jgi:membrane-associated phospholipid phosphatase
MFGIDFKKGLVLTHVLIVTGLLTEMLKHIFLLPRPYNVDSNIKLLGKNIQNDSPFTNGGADNFFGLPAADVIEYYRNKTGTLFGLPSGHTSTAVTLWGSIILFYNQYAIKIICLILIVMIPFSRMYLGVHFLGDILAGYLVGGILLLVFYFIYYKNRFRRFSSRSIKYSSKFFIHLVYLLFAPLIYFVTFPEIHTRLSGTLLGINFLLLFFTVKGFPILHKSLVKRILSSIIALIFFVFVSFILYQLFTVLISDSQLIQFTTSGFITAFGFWASLKICVGLNLLKIDPHYE